jgi:electron transfer flavoprotein beta subunit
MPEDAVSFIGFADLDDRDESHYGLSGSATKVERIFPPEKNEEKHELCGSPAEQASGILSLLLDKKLI